MDRLEVSPRKGCLEPVGSKSPFIQGLYMVEEELMTDYMGRGRCRPVFCPVACSEAGMIEFEVPPRAAWVRPMQVVESWRKKLQNVGEDSQEKLAERP